jgi:hypothetical protein
VDVGFLDHREQGLLGPPARLEQLREEASLPQLRDPQVHPPHPGVPGTFPVAVAIGRPLGCALVLLGPDPLAGLQLDDRLGQHLEALPQEVHVPIHPGLAQQVKK